VHPASISDDALADDFKSDEEAELRPTAREKRVRELCKGMSAYGSLTAARLVWDSIRQRADELNQPVKVGYYIAKVELEPESGFLLEDLNEPDEHLTIWGDRHRLAGAVSRIYAAQTEGK
jgi:hypothetical protein